MKSPTLKGRNSTSSTPDAKLDRDPCSARPTARPAAPTTATKEVVLTPSLSTAASTTRVIIIMKVMLPKNLVTVLSTFRLSRTFSRTRSIPFATHLPTMRMMMAVRSRRPKSMTMAWICSGSSVISMSCKGLGQVAKQGATTVREAVFLERSRQVFQRIHEGFDPNPAGG